MQARTIVDPFTGRELSAMEYELSKDLIVDTPNGPLTLKHDVDDKDQAWYRIPAKSLSDNTLNVSYSADTAAKIIGCSRQNVINQYHKGGLKGQVINGRVYVGAKSVIDYVAHRGQSAS